MHWEIALCYSYSLITNPSLYYLSESNISVIPLLTSFMKWIPWYPPPQHLLFHLKCSFGVRDLERSLLLTLGISYNILLIHIPQLVAKVKISFTPYSWNFTALSFCNIHSHLPPYRPTSPLMTKFDATTTPRGFRNQRQLSILRAWIGMYF